MSRLARHSLCAALLLVCIGPLSAARASAHPMPNPVIAISLGDDGARFDIAVPVPELQLALPASRPRNADLLAEPPRSALIAYFKVHWSVRSTSGAAQSPVIQSCRSGKPAMRTSGRTRSCECGCLSMMRDCTKTVLPETVREAGIGHLFAVREKGKKRAMSQDCSDIAGET